MLNWLKSLRLCGVIKLKINICKNEKTVEIMDKVW